MADQPLRFLTLTDVAEILNTSSAQVYALVRRKELKALKMGGRGQWRVEASELEEFIARMYDETDAYIDEHPFTETDENAPTANRHLPGLNNRQFCLRGPGPDPASASPWLREGA